MTSAKNTSRPLSVLPKIALPHREFLDDQFVVEDRNDNCQPRHFSDGDVQREMEFVSIENWKEASRIFTAKIAKQSDGFIKVTTKKHRPRKYYSSITRSVTTRLAAGKLLRVSFSHRLK